MTTINSGRWSIQEHNQLLSNILNQKNISYINDISDKINNFVKNGKKDKMDRNWQKFDQK